MSAHLQRLIQTATLPLQITLSPAASRSYTSTPPYLLHFPRLSYLPLLLPRLHAFFAPHLIDPALARDSEAWFEYQGVVLKWGWAVGLLFDLHGGAGEEGGTGAWELTLHYGDFPEERLVRLDDGGRVVWDMFVNAVKEADFVRNGSARAVMGLSLGDSEALWRGVREDDWDLFNSVNAKLLAPPGLTVKHVPIKFYLPAAASTTSTSQTLPEGSEPQPGHIRVVQALVPLQLPSKQPQTLGTALNSVLPGIFPSRRAPLLAQPVLHGAVVPMGANLGELGRVAGFADGLLHVVVAMLG